MATNKRSTSSTTATEKTTVNHLLLGCTKRDASRNQNYGLPSLRQGFFIRPEALRNSNGSETE